MCSSRLKIIVRDESIAFRVFARISILAFAVRAFVILRIALRVRQRCVMDVEIYVIEFTVSIR